MRFVEGGDDFRINNDKIIYDQIWYEIANKFTVVENRKAPLHINHVTASLKLKDQRAFVKFFIQSGL